MWKILEKLVGWKTLLIALAGVFAVQAFIGAYLLPRIQAKKPDVVVDRVLIMMDMRPLATAEDVRKIFSLYTPDIVGDVRVMYASDFLLPLALTAFYIATIGLALKAFDKAERWRWLLPATFFPVIFDYLENCIGLLMLSRGVSPALAGVVGLITAIKWAGYVSVILVVAISAIAGTGKFVYDRYITQRNQ